MTFRSSNRLRMAGLVGVVLSLGLGMTVSPIFAVVAAGIWVGMAVTGNGPCCWDGACSTRQPKPRTQDRASV